MAFDQGSSSDNSIAQINVTPLVDVPKVAAGPLTGDEEQLVVNVAKGGKLYLNDTALAPGDLATKLAAIARARPDRQVYVRADQTVPYGEVMAVIGSIRDAGLARVGLVTEPPAERSR